MLPSHTYSDSTLINLATARYTPRWIVVCIEVCLLFIALFLSFFVVERLGVYISDSIPLYKRYFLVIGVNLFFMFVFRTYSGIIRHSTFRDLFIYFLNYIFRRFTLFEKFCFLIIIFLDYVKKSRMVCYPSYFLNRRKC